MVRTLQNFFRAVQIGKKLTKQAHPYQSLSSDTSISLLVLGDSLGVGVGAEKPEDSVAGRFAKFLGATYVENHSVSGAVVADLPLQIAKATLERYSVVLIHIGANDIIRFHNARKVSRLLGNIFATLPPSSRLFLLTAGDVGGATIFPPFLRPHYTRLTLRYHALFGEVTKAHRVTYVNLYQPPENDPFRHDPQRYFAPDGLHPSGEGYRLWYEALIRSFVRMSE